MCFISAIKAYFLCREIDSAAYMIRHEADHYDCPYAKALIQVYRENKWNYKKLRTAFDNWLKS